MIKKIAIANNPTRNREIVELLVSLGGSYLSKFVDSSGLAYFVNDEGYVVRGCPPENSFIITLENFELMFPFKVRDKVLYKNRLYVVKGMEWNGCCILYTISNSDGFILSGLRKDSLTPYEKQNTEENSRDLYCTLTPKGHMIIPPVDYEIKQDGNEFYLVKKGPQYPNTYEECCKVLNHIIVDNVKGYKDSLLELFQRLLVCRDAYWKIAGDWEVDLVCGEDKYTITYAKKEIKCLKTIEYNRILVFPTKEMRDAFYENFKDLIESVKELL